MSNARMTLAALAVLGLASSLGAKARKDAAARIVSTWPEITRKAAGALIEKYGAPSEADSRAVAWEHKDGFRRIAVYAQPGSMGDRRFIEHCVRYTVPPQRVEDVKAFDPGLSVDAAAGTLTAQSDSEGSNLLALNLADEIATGKRSPESAKMFRLKTVFLSEAGKRSPYMEKLLFAPGRR
jgi:hypothetical protein